MSSHDEVFCYACGETLDGPEEAPTGLCKNENDAGKNTTCTELSGSCMTGILSEILTLKVICDKVLK